MQKHSISPIKLISNLWFHRNLFFVLTKQEINGRYKGSMAGILWSFFHPLFILGIYTFAFGIVFKMNWRATPETRGEFALILFSGLMVFNLFSECLNKSPLSIISNANFVKKVIFPLEILPCVIVGSALFHMLISAGVWIIAYMFLVGIPHLSIFLLPLAIMPLCLFSIGVSWILAGLAVYLRDVTQIMGVVASAFLFISPVFYSLASIPEEYQYLMLLNPLTAVVENTRNLLFFGIAPNINGMLISILVSAFVAWLGFALFQNMRKGFSDAL